MSPLVSVLMPALNEEQAIAGALEAVLAQHDVDLEVLVIHGRSVDRTGEIVAQIAASDPRVRVIENPRNLIPIALNLGLAAARGEFVARIDAHSDASPDYLRRGVDWLRGNPRLASVGGIRRGVACTPVGRSVALALSSKAAIGDSINHYATEPQLTDHASMAVTRVSAARQVGGWDETLQVNEDVDFDHRLNCGGTPDRLRPGNADRLARARDRASAVSAVSPVRTWQCSDDPEERDRRHPHPAPGAAGVRHRFRPGAAGRRRPAGVVVAAGPLSRCGRRGRLAHLAGT